MVLSRRRSAAAAGGKKRPRSTFDLAGGRDHDDGIAPALYDEELDSAGEDGDDFSDEDDGVATEDEESEEEETVDEKRLRLARDYLSKLEAQSSSSDDEASDSDDQDPVADGAASAKDRVGKRLAKERLQKLGLLETLAADSVLESIQAARGSIAAKIGIDAASSAWLGGAAAEGGATEAYAKAWLDAGYVTYHRGHDLTPTAVALSRDGRAAFSGAKDGSLVMWDVERGRKVSRILPVVGAKEGSRNQREILALASSDDGRYLAVGGRDNCVRIFDVRTLGKTAAAAASVPSHPPVATMEGHKKAVTSLAFRARSLDLYSGSDDRCIRRYDLAALTYVETLYGHQSPVVGLACAHKNRPVSVARDRTVRVWKVEEDSHLVYRPGGGAGGADCVAAVRDGWFATGHEDGMLALWRQEKKRPVGGAVAAAHGYHGGAGGVARSIACCAALGLSDVLATGSSDGYLRLWRVNSLQAGTTEADAGIKPLDSVPIHGHINSIAVGPEGKFCVAAVGQEPRLGRWDRVPRAKNRFAIIRLKNHREEGV